MQKWHKHFKKKGLKTNLRWARNTKYSLLNIQNLWNRIASRIVNFPILHTTLSILHRLHNQGQNTINLNLNKNFLKWKTWKRAFILALHKCQVTFNMSLQSSMHLKLQLHSRTETTRQFWMLFLYASSSMASGVKVGQVLKSQSN